MPRCCEQAIRYPTDLSLLNEAREFSEQIIDKLYPRTELKKNHGATVLRREKPTSRLPNGAGLEPG